MITEEFEEIVRRRIEELDEAEDETASGETPDNNPENGSDAESSNDAEETEETFTAADFGDFLEKTESKVTVKKEGSMPSPIFGSHDLKNHNKYRVTIENPKGKISFIYWDSIANTEANKPMNKEDALACFANDTAAYESAPSYEEFKEAFGYDETTEELAQKAYEGCRKQMDKAKKLFDEAQLKELQRLGGEH